jgi:transposase
MARRRSDDFSAKISRSNKGDMEWRNRGREANRLVEARPDPEKDGFARWRCVDLKRVLGARFAVDVSAVSLGRILRKLGLFPHQRTTAAPQPEPGGDCEL